MKHLWASRLLVCGFAFLTSLAFTRTMPMPTNSLKYYASLQRGAKYFMNYCVGCHGLHYMRYNQLANDLGLLNDQGQVEVNFIKKNLFFTDTSLNNTIEASLLPEEASHWLGVSPPDLSLIARVHNRAWIFAFLNSFYPDSQRPFGVNNTLVPNTAMPDVLWSFKVKKKVQLEKTKQQKQENTFLTSTSLLKSEEAPELRSSKEFEQMSMDLANFLEYVGDPTKMIRHARGVKAIGFLLLFILLTYFLKKHYWN